jgi:hypothetical protein
MKTSELLCQACWAIHPARAMETPSGDGPMIFRCLSCGATGYCGETAPLAVTAAFIGADAGMRRWVERRRRRALVAAWRAA